LEIVYVFQKITSFAFLVFVKYIDTGMSTDCESPAYLSWGADCIQRADLARSLERDESAEKSCADWKSTSLSWHFWSRNKSKGSSRSAGRHPIHRFTTWLAWPWLLVPGSRKLSQLSCPHSTLIGWPTAERKAVKSRSVPLRKNLYEELIEQLPFQSCYSAFRSALERANIKLPKGQLTHICRHTFASHFVMNGGHILTLQKVLGHSDLKLTMRYAHLAPDFLSEVLHKSPAI